LFSDLFIYCGHGSGEQLYLKHDRSLISERKRSSCNASYSFAACFLWGCSSVRLKDRGLHEPSGPLLLLLERNSPFVVGNLWDVTDKDIDRLSISCMGDYFRFPRTSPIAMSGGCTDIKAQNLSACLVNSRKVCKLPFAVGSSPVVYGIPLLVRL
jgi:separase